MTTQEEQEAIRKDREAQVRAAWQVLAETPEFQTVFELDLQVHFNLHRASFQSGDQFNPCAAAQRDGQKQVISHIAKRVARGKVVEE